MVRTGLFAHSAVELLTSERLLREPIASEGQLRKRLALRKVAERCLCLKTMTLRGTQLSVYDFAFGWSTYLDVDITYTNLLAFTLFLSLIALCLLHTLFQCFGAINFL